MTDPTQRRLCAVCSDAVDPEDAHWPHEADCPNSGHAATHACTCDLLAHPECCPEPGCGEAPEPAT